MTLTTDLPWNEIATPDTDYNVRLVASHMSIPVYWGRAALGQPLVIIELAGDHTREFSRAPVIVRGIGIDLQAGKTDATQRLVLTLQHRSDADLFFALCSTLLAALAPVTDSSVALAVTLAHLQRWKAFFAGKRSGLLSPEQVRGLIAELTMLRSLYQSGISRAVAIEAWTGADGVQQDFVFANRAVEVKSVTGKERNAVRISSEDQLETIAPQLFLVVYRLTELPDAPESRSLNETISRMESELGVVEAVEGFQRRLAAAGYLPLPDYDEPKYTTAVLASYSVVEGFPRLVRSALPHGIARVSYEIELESIAPFECAFDSVTR